MGNVTRNEEYLCEILEIRSLSEIEIFPLYMQIETSSKCNSKCIMCPRSKNPPRRQTTEMEDWIFNKVLEDLRPFAGRMRKVVPQGFGEPLMDHKLPSRITRLKEIGIKQVVISTNASLLDEGKSRDILESGLDQIDFSIDAVTKDSYERIRRGLNFEVVVQNIKSFIRIRDAINAKTRVRFRYIIQPENEHEYEDFCAFWKKIVREDDIIYGKKIHTFGGHVEMPNKTECRELKDRLTGLPCKGIFGSIVVFCDGQVPICGVDVNQDYIAGNIKASSLEEIWRGRLFTEFRKKHLEAGRSSYDHCPNCNSWAPELKMPDA